MDKSLEGSKSRHPAFQKTRKPAFDINTIIRYDLNTGLYSVNNNIDDVDTIYDEVSGGWRSVRSADERRINITIIDTLIEVCNLLNEMTLKEMNENDKTK